MIPRHPGPPAEKVAFGPPEKTNQTPNLRRYGWMSRGWFLPDSFSHTELFFPTPDSLSHSLFGWFLMSWSFESNGRFRMQCIFQVGHTVDGRNPAPVGMVNIPLSIGFYTSQVVQDFFHQQYYDPWIFREVFLDAKSFPTVNDQSRI